LASWLLKKPLFITRRILKGFFNLLVFFIRK
jgi:hypothetical protein